MFEFTYKSEIEIDKDKEYCINMQKRREEEYFAKWGGILDKSGIPSSGRCNNEKECCPYCVLDACLKFGGLLESTMGLYGFSFQRKNRECLKKYPKGKKNIDQIELDEIEEGEAE